MMPGPDNLIECPVCKRMVIQRTLSSGNTFGAQRWSDGYVKAPMLPHLPEITKCVGCEQIFWLSKGKLVDRIFFIASMNSNQYDLTNVVYAAPLVLSDLSGFIESKKHTKKEEKYLRLRLWWRHNHRHRVNPVYSFSTTQHEYFNKNLKRIISLMSINNIDEILFRMEAFRELNEFDEAKTCLKEISEKHAELKEQYLQKIQQCDARVFEFR